MARHLAHPVHGGGGVAEAVGEGEEIVVEHVLPGGGQRGHRPAVEGVFQGQNGAPALAVLVKGVLPGQLDEPLVALRAGVAEKHVGHARALAEHLGQRAQGSV